MSYKEDERHRAICRGLRFIYRLACDPKVFSDHGSDLLSCFELIASRSKKPALRSLALSLGRERALQWRRERPFLPEDADADEIAEFVQGTDAADRLGVHNRTLKRIIKQAAMQFSATDYLWFDPHLEPPPTDVPEQCRCGLWNDRGSKTCRKCKRKLSLINRYWVWYFALTRTSIGESYGVRLGSPYREVIKWISKMRPYSTSENSANSDFYDSLYAITHVVYTLNDYNRYRLSRSWLPSEFQFLKESAQEAIGQGDVEMLGEILDSLKGFGLSNSHPILKFGIDYLLRQQNKDGSWGERITADSYKTYHTTWTVIDGLRDYAWQGWAPLSSRIMKSLK